MAVAVGLAVYLIQPSLMGLLGQEPPPGFDEVRPKVAGSPDPPSSNETIFILPFSKCILGRT